MKLKIKVKKEKNKWNWATPEKLNPDSQKHAVQGALILIAAGIVFIAAGLFLTTRFNTASFSNFTGTESSYPANDTENAILLFFNAPWIIGIWMLTGGLISLRKFLFPHIFRS